MVPTFRHKMAICERPKIMFIFNNFLTNYSNLINDKPQFLVRLSSSNSISFVINLINSSFKIFIEREIFLLLHPVYDYGLYNQHFNYFWNRKERFCENSDYGLKHNSKISSPYLRKCYKCIEPVSYTHLTLPTKA